VSATWIINPLDPDYGMLSIGQTGGVACEGGSYYGFLSPDGGRIVGIGRGGTTSEFQCGNTWPAPTVIGFRN